MEKQNAAYKCVCKIAKVATNSFFREIKVIGLNNIPQNEPIIICSNHNNQFMDGLLLVSQLNRCIKFIVADKSMKRPIIGHFAKALGGIPVKRADDLAFKGKGTISYIGEGKIQGSDTQFQQQCEVGCIIALKDQQLTIKQIISETELIIQEQELKLPINQLEYKIIPKMDQSQMYEKVWEALHQNQCIGIFPEGGSHDRTDLLPLKAGVCIMALGAMAKYDIKVKIVPCGINYFRGHRFRSKVIIEFGQSYEIPQELLEMYKKSKRNAISKLLKEIETRLRDTTIQMPSYKELNAIYMARSIYLHDVRNISPKEELRLNRTFAQAYTSRVNTPQVKQILENIIKYEDMLKSLGTSDYQVKTFSQNFKVDFTSFFISFVKTLLSLGFSLPALILNSPIAFLLRYLSEKERIKCLNNSKVKILGNDVVASYKVLCAFVILPMSNLFYTTIFNYIIRKKCKLIRPKNVKFFTLLFFFLYPFYAFIMLKSADSLTRNLRTLQSKYLFFTNKEKYQKLRQQREELYVEIREFMREHTNSTSQVFKNDSRRQSDSDLMGKPRMSFSSFESLDQKDNLFDVLSEIGC